MLCVVERREAQGEPEQGQQLWQLERLVSLPQISSFLCHDVYRGGVLFGKLSIPSAEVFSDAREFCCKCNVVFVLQRFCLPQDLQEYLYRIYFSQC